MCRIEHMKTITIRELHMKTGEYVRQALEEPLIITQRGQAIAVLKPLQSFELIGAKMPKRKLSDLPKVKIDSTPLVSDERDAR